MEEALRESVDITAESEAELVRHEGLLRAAEDKVLKLQTELRGLQNGHNARCTSCPDLRLQLRDVGRRHQALWDERKKHLEELYDMKLEALSAAISEKDAHLALLEEQGFGDERSTLQAHKLRNERKQLVDRIRIENESRVKIITEAAEALRQMNGTHDKGPEEEMEKKDSAS